MQKAPRRLSDDDLKKERFSVTEVCAILGIHRSTLGRLASTNVLPPDGQTASRRRYWLRATVEAYRLGIARNAATAYIATNQLPELQLRLSPGSRILGQMAACIPLPDETRANAIASLIAALVASPPTVLALPAHTVDQHLHKTVVEICTLRGTAVLLHPAF